MEKGQLVSLAQEYHSYSCKEQVMKLVYALSTIGICLGAGLAAINFNQRKNMAAIVNCSSMISVAGLGAYVGKRRNYYANKVEDTRVELRNLEYKLLEKRDPCSLPIQTKEDTERKKHRVSGYDFYRI